MTIEVRRVELDNEMSVAVSRLRVWAWKEREPAFAEYSGDMIDKYDAVAFHFGAFQASEMVGSARLNVASTIAEVPDFEVFKRPLETEDKWPVAVFSRLVVAPESGQLGIPRLLRAPREELAIKHKCSKILLWLRQGMRPHQSFLDEGFEEIARAEGHSVSELNEIFKAEVVKVMEKPLLVA